MDIKIIVGNHDKFIYYFTIYNHLSLKSVVFGYVVRKNTLYFISKPLYLKTLTLPEKMNIFIKNQNII